MSFTRNLGMRFLISEFSETHPSHFRCDHLRCRERQSDVSFQRRDTSAESGRQVQRETGGENENRDVGRGADEGAVVGEKGGESAEVQSLHREGLDEASELDFESTGELLPGFLEERAHPGVTVMTGLPGCGGDTGKEPGRCQMSSHDVSVV